MQTFLPYSNFTQSAHVLDNQRLVKQVTEALQILGTIQKPQWVCKICKGSCTYGVMPIPCKDHPDVKNIVMTGWKNHPAVRQWNGYDKALICYTIAMSDECVSRGFKEQLKVSELKKSYDSQCCLPSWVGNDDVHSSHRSRLLFKGRVDAVCSSIKKFLNVRSITAWLTTNGLPTKNAMTIEYLTKLEELATRNNLNVPPNYYTQFGWTEIDTNGYIWPV